MSMNLSQLATDEYEITNLFAIRQKWSPNSVFHMNKPRKSTGFIFLNGCSGEYIDREQRRFLAPPKSLVCLPFGSEYSVLNLERGIAYPDAWLVELNIVQNDTVQTLGKKPFLICDINPFLISQCMEEIVQNAESPIFSPARLKASVYRLLVEMAKADGALPRHQYQRIAPALHMLMHDPIHSPSVKQLAKVCHLSESSFRRLFIAYCGKSPLQYKLDLKIGIAKRLLDNNEMTIEQIADSLAFESSAYFCRMFKQHTALTPKEYQRSCLR